MATVSSSSLSQTHSDRINEWSIGIVVFCITALISAGVILHFDDMHIEKTKHEIKAISDKNVFYLHKNIDQIMALCYPIASTVLEDGSINNFEFIAEKLIAHYPLISEIALAPKGIITRAVPLRGNEKAIGFNLFTDSQQQAEAFMARESGKLTLAGPLHLVQGGEGLVGRMPIFRGADKKFWGFVLIVIPFPEILQINTLQTLSHNGYQYTLTRLHPKTKKLQTIAASSIKSLDHPMETIIKLPNANWTLSIAPTNGWHDHWFLALQSALGFLVSLLMGYIAKQYVELRHHRSLLERHVEERTSEILKTKNQLHALLDTIPDLIWLKNKEGVYLLCNPMFERFFGSKEEEIVGKTDYDFVDAELADFFREHDHLSMYADKPTVNEEWVTFAEDGHKALLETIKTPMYDENHTLVGVLGISRDITQRHNDELHIKRLSQIHAALSQANHAIVHSSTANELFIEICKSIVSVGGMEMAWIGLVNPDTGIVTPTAFYGAGVNYLEGIIISVNENDPYGKGPTAIAMRENRPFWCQDFMNDPLTAPWHERGAAVGWKASAALPILQYGNVIGVLTIYSDILNAFDASIQALLIEMIMDVSYGIENYDREIKRKSAEEKAHWLAHFDILTGLPNRTLLNDRVQNAINIAARTNVPLALIFLDLDHFKNINDTLGHNIGDAFLIEIASRIHSVMREGDTLSRQGGDEFVILLPGTDAEGAAHIAEKLLTAISQTFRKDQHELIITASIGIALYPIDGRDVQGLFQSADAAMYRAKYDGRNCYRFFTSEIQTRFSRNFELENGLRHALERNELELYYQPQIAIHPERLIGAEALLRWKHPTLGAISPVEFIPVAENSGQIIAIGEWVLRRALQQLKEWIESGMEPFIMAVNLSAIQFRDPKFIALVLNILEEIQISPEFLELELTESIAMENPLEAIEIMNALHKHGIRMSIDDFGTGYSSLNYLKKFKVYKLKIDQSFIRDISENSDDKTIVNTIINMAHNLNMQTIAEGVETLEQLEFLRQNGCDEVQGYYFSQPIPSAEFEAFQHSHSR
ncbi:EAL domain-containing protein [Sulfuricurvum sp.]|uniref:bifunctional diguanylate cyclase/phosphodiesterase n=1 Tax=Sulfuricurvum sp. TaxID=2025608 RepID=UPI00286DE619|nr:EAL domain-containing protein [Sulfuricurvum sp.]